MGGWEMRVWVAGEQGGRGRVRGHKYASPAAIFVEKLWLKLQAREEALLTAPAHFQFTAFSGFSTHIHADAYTHHHEAANTVSLWCIKTNINSLQINYQLSPWPCLSNKSLRELKWWAIPCPLPRSTWADSYFPLATLFQHLIHPPHTPTNPLALTHCVGREDEPVKQSLGELALCQGELSHVP